MGARAGCGGWGSRAPGNSAAADCPIENRRPRGRGDATCSPYPGETGRKELSISGAIKRREPAETIGEGTGRAKGIVAPSLFGKDRYLNLSLVFKHKFLYSKRFNVTREAQMYDIEESADFTRAQVENSLGISLLLTFQRTWQHW